jgi:carbamoylphosphate synthase small subunit
MESKSGSIESKNICHSAKVKLAMRDLADKVSGKNISKDKKRPNNPWKNAYSHASHYDVGTSDEIRNDIRRLSNDFTNDVFYDIEKFNTMPCSTIFLSGVWNPKSYDGILKEIQGIIDKLKGKKIHVICITQKSVILFLQYIGLWS